MNSDPSPLVSSADRPTAEQLRAELDRISGKGKKGGGRGFLRFLLVLILLVAVLAAAVILLFPAFVVYGNSMAPALHEGDLVLAAADTSPDIGDLVAFRSGERVLIKRVVGCPGDSIEVQDDGRVLVNGEKLSEPYALLTGDAAGELDYPVTLPDDGYFVLGDNRGSSVDSRLRISTSSRQSPNKSAWRQGFDLVPLLNCPSSFCTLTTVCCCQSYFDTVSWSSSSRSRSPSHQMPKLMERRTPADPPPAPPC